MLYNNFIVCMMTCAFFALLRMIDNQEWEYIILPIGILIWGVFKFFDENDREYLLKQGIDPDEYNAFFPELYDEGYNKHKILHTQPKKNGNVLIWDNNSASTRVEDSFNYDLFGGNKQKTEDYTKYQPKTYTRFLDNLAYKGMAKKCRRNFKISLIK